MFDKTELLKRPKKAALCHVTLQSNGMSYLLTGLAVFSQIFTNAAFKYG